MINFENLIEVLIKLLRFILYSIFTIKIIVSGWNMVRTFQILMFLFKYFRTSILFLYLMT